MVMLPTAGRAFNVGEEEGDGAGGKIGHGASQDARLDMNPVECRMGVQGLRACFKTCSASCTT
jgi:hypothetical protein